MNQKGQAFAGYRLLIGAILGLMILVIIVAGITAVEQIKYEISNQRLFSMAQTAPKNPSTDVLIVENLSLKEGTAFSKETFSEQMGIPGDCITFDVAPLPSINHSGKVIVFEKTVEIDVYFVCETVSPLCDGTSDVECTIYFGKTPP